MRYFHMIMLAAVLVLVSACAKMGVGGHSRDYAKASSVHPLVIPAGAAAPKQKPFYAVPNRSVTADSQPVSIVPPGSKIQAYRSAEIKTDIKLARARLQRRNGGEQLVLASTVNKIWARVGRALSQSPYKILDRDRSMHVYYVVDTPATQNKITRATPIYRLDITAQPRHTVAISINDKLNKPLSDATAKRVLGDLQKRLG